MVVETHKRRFDHLIGIGFSVVSAIAFGTVAPLAKAAYDRGAEPLALLTVRFGVAGILLVIFLKIKGQSCGRDVPLRCVSLRSELSVTPSRLPCSSSHSSTRRPAS